MRRFFAALIAIAAFTATVALVNSMGATFEAGLNFNIQDAAETLATIVGRPIADIAIDANVPLEDEALIATGVGAFGLALPSAFAFVLFSGR